MKRYRESTYNQMQEAIDFLDSLPIDSPVNSVWWCLHQVVWHAYLDRTLWIVQNKDLITRLAQHPSLPPDDLLKEFKESVQKMVSQIK